MLRIFNYSSLCSSSCTMFTLLFFSSRCSKSVLLLEAHIYPSHLSIIPCLTEQMLRSSLLSSTHSNLYLHRRFYDSGTYLIKIEFDTQDGSYQLLAFLRNDLVCTLIKRKQGKDKDQVHKSLKGKLLNLIKKRMNSVPFAHIT